MTRKTNTSALYTHLINWEPLEVAGSQGFAWIKTLAKDESTGARTALIRYDPGFTAQPSVSTWPTDIYTLDGEMTAGDHSYEKDTYHYRPAGTAIGPISAPRGATRLIFTADTADPSKSSAEEIFIQNIMTDLQPDPPGAGEDPKVTMRWRKTLRQDPVAGYSLRAQRSARAGVQDHSGSLHIHPWTEEAYMISGLNQDYSGDIDGHIQWMAGLYVCRPPNGNPHGNSLKLDDNYYMIVRGGWSDDPAVKAEWKRLREASITPLLPVQFVE
jgi:hypothetical protein